MLKAYRELERALGKRPELLLLDEPLADLDPLVRHELMQVLMEEVAGGGLTVVLSSHVIPVRVRGPVRDPAWGVRDVSLEQLVLAYMRHPAASVLPPLKEVPA